jgi:glycosyltransferase involved in cell wall biosynthesis
MQNSKVIYISRAVFPNKSANSVHLMKMSQAISRNFRDVTLIGLKEQKNRIIKKEIFENYDINSDFNLKLISMPKRGIWIYLLIYVFFWLNFQSRKNKIIYSREPLIIFLSLFLGFKAILESHDFFESKSKRNIEKKIFKHKNFLKLIVISNALKNDYLMYFKIIPNIEVHHDGADIINLNSFNNFKWTGRKDVLQVGYFGHLYKGRGVEIIIDAAHKLNNFDFHIFGGLDSDINRYKSQPLSSNIYFHGFKQQKDLPFLRSKCDILLMPYQKKLSLYKSDRSTAKWMSPMKLFEYMSSKKAIVSSDIPVLREILNDQNSILVKPDDLSGWINAIISLYDKKLRNKLACNAYSDFIENYTWDKRATSIFSNLQ